MVRVSRWPRGAISLLVVCMLSLGPWTQGVDTGPDGGIEPVEGVDVVTPASMVGPDAGELLSNIGGFFTENLGQKGDGAGKYYCQGDPLSVAFSESSISYVYAPDGSEQGSMFRVRFEGSNDIDPVGQNSLRHLSNYFIGNDPDEWVVGAHNFERIAYGGLYDGIDAVYYFSDGMLKYDIVVSPEGNPGDIVLDFDGVQDISVDPSSGDLVIRTEVGLLVDPAPFTYQETPMGLSEIPSRYSLVGKDKVTFSVADYDTGIPLVIDPGLRFSTYIGGSHEEFVNPSLDLDDVGNIYLFSSTDSTDFPTTVGVYDRTYNGGNADTVVVKVKSDGSSLLYSTYLGGSGSETVSDLRTISNGSVLLAGVTDSTDFPTTSNAYQGTNKGHDDIVVASLNSTGSKLLFSTYIGGRLDDGDQGFSYMEIAIDSAGNIYLGGVTLSSDFPVVDGCYDTTFDGSSAGFIVKMDPTATTLLRSTFLGKDRITGISLPRDDTLYVAGITYGDFPVTQGAYCTTENGGLDVFYAHMDTNLTTITYGTYIGGSDMDYDPCIKVNRSGYAFLAGYTYSGDYPTTEDAFDTSYNGAIADFFISVINPAGDELTYSTFLGGSEFNLDIELELDDNDQVYIASVTNSTDMPTTENAYDDTSNGKFDCHLCCFVSNLTELSYASYLGGSGIDWPGNILVEENYVIVGGHTGSRNFPTTPGAYSTTYAGGEMDLFLSSLEVGDLNGTPPSVPVNISVSTGDRSVTIGWDPPEDTGNLILRGFRVYRGVTHDKMNIISQVSPDQPFFTDRALTMGQEYYYAISALNGIGEGNRSQVVSVTPYGTPLAPDLSATPGCASVRLAWGPPDDTGGLPLLGYRLFRSSDEVHFQNIFNTSSETVHNDTGLENGRTYYYRVLAFNSMGNGTYCDVVNATPSGPPSVPRYFKVTAGDTTIELEWRAPLSDGGSSITGYEVLRGSTASSLEVHRTVDQASESYVDTSLTNGVTYFYAIRAINDISTGPLTLTMNATPVGHPGIPGEFRVSGGDGHVNLSWSAPGSDGGTPIMRYEVFRGTTDSDLVSIGIADGEMNAYTDDGLLNGMAFFYAVCAVNRVGNGPWTEILPATPLALPDAPGDLVALAGNRMVTISWTRPMDDGGAEVTLYHIYRGTSEDGLERLTSKAKSVFIYDDADVTAGTTYYYAVTAETAAGEGPRSITASATPFGPPGVPVDLETTSGNQEVRLTWSPPDDDGASPIEGYVILRGTSEASLRELTQLGYVGSYLDTSVTNGETYFYAIAAINEAGPGEYTDAIPATPEKPVTPPGSVRTLVVDAKGAKVTLQWTAPLDDGGSPLTGYVVLRGLSKDALEQVAEVGPNVITWSEDGLERGTTYYYSVAAKNDVGEGEPILAREVPIEKEKDEGPGFEVIAVMAAMMVIVPLVRRRWVR